ncbi:MAG: hypothetical protein AB7G93_19220 [Bdellovibrionales bacterium]
MRPITEITVILFLVLSAGSRLRAESGSAKAATADEAVSEAEAEKSHVVESHSAAVHMVHHAAKESSRDVRLPHALVARIEKEYKSYQEKLKAGVVPAIKRDLLNTSVELTQDRRGALHENTRIATPVGGGVVDLAEVVTPVRGAFHVKIVAKTDKDEPIEDLRVFFVSRGKKRRIAGQDFGAGCGKFMDITRYFHKRMADSGFDLYTADQRYVSVLAGTFVLVGFDPETLHVGSVSFTDSRFSDLLCE